MAIELLAAVAGLGMVGVIGLAIYIAVQSRENNRLFRANVDLKVDVASLEGQLANSESELLAYKQLVEALDAEGGECVVDPETADRLSPGTLRERIDNLVRTNEDRVRTDIIESLDTPDDEDAAVGGLGDSLR